MPKAEIDNENHYQNDRAKKNENHYQNDMVLMLEIRSKFYSFS